MAENKSAPERHFRKTGIEELLICYMFFTIGKRFIQWIYLVARKCCCSKRMENWKRPALKSRKFAFKLGFWPYSGSVALAFKNDFKTKFNESTGFYHMCIV